MAHLTWTVDDDVATLVLDNPPQNRIGLEMVEELGEALDAVERSDARAVLLRAEGADFSFGGDIEPWPDWDERELRANFERFLSTFNRFERLPVPTVAAVQGLCFGGGLELAVRSDVIIAGRGARFGHPEQSIAIVTLLGGIYRVAARAGRARAMEWTLTSQQVPADEMERFGVVNRVVPDDTLLEEATGFARAVAKGPTKAHAAHKALLRTWEAGGVAAADEVMFDVALPLWRTEDTRLAIPTAVAALKAGRPRPAIPYTGR
ncbi:enoyl-CoA hydratase/isomerase family protein [Pseudonocardia xishanensis]|uniref:Enoyl-CoA hydratase/isomerase family protein n=1 Tax=Pseudonocardia xishanensis TaxID=630995 RepID=A0ABP8RUZ3_9PSEU